MVIFRDARREDVPAIVALLADDVLGSGRETDVDAAYLAAFDDIAADARNRLIVAEIDGQVAGTLQLTLLPGLSRHGMLRAQIEAVRVGAGQRGQGLGRAMIEWAIGEARGRGCGLVQLTSDKQRADAIRFYESMGFTASHEGLKLPLLTSDRYIAMGDRRRARAVTDLRDPATHHPRTMGAATVAQKARILLVDDRDENLVALEAILSSLGQTIVRARSGEAALKALRSAEFAVILLDVVMPGMDGFETAASIKRHTGASDVPIIFLTAAGAEPDHAFRGYSAGAVDYIVKPFDPWVLSAKVAFFVDLYIKNRQLREQAELLRRQAESARAGSIGAPGLLAELSRRLAAVEITAAGLAGLPVVKTDTALAGGLVELDRGIGRLRDSLDALGSEG
jgi:CheY-like chemotaxis protein/GNAT superfamily N-acetyltransferase